MLIDINPKKCDCCAKTSRFAPCIFIGSSAPPPKLPSTWPCPIPVSRKQSIYLRTIKAALSTGPALPGRIPHHRGRTASAKRRTRRLLVEQRRQASGRSSLCTFETIMPTPAARTAIATRPLEAPRPRFSAGNCRTSERGQNQRWRCRSPPLCRGRPHDGQGMERFPTASRVKRTVCATGKRCSRRRWRRRVAVALCSVMITM